jgi:hypothetical protein
MHTIRQHTAAASPGLSDQHLFSSPHAFTLTSCNHTQTSTMPVEFVPNLHAFCTFLCLALLIEIAHTPLLLFSMFRSRRSDMSRLVSYGLLERPNSSNTLDVIHVCGRWQQLHQLNSCKRQIARLLPTFTKWHHCTFHHPSIIDSELPCNSLENFFVRTTYSVCFGSRSYVRTRLQ